MASSGNKQTLLPIQTVSALEIGHILGNLMSAVDPLRSRIAPSEDDIVWANALATSPRMAASFADLKDLKDPAKRFPPLGLTTIIETTHRCLRNLGMKISATLDREDPSVKKVAGLSDIWDQFKPDTDNEEAYLRLLERDASKPAKTPIAIRLPNDPNTIRFTLDNQKLPGLREQLTPTLIALEWRSKGKGGGAGSEPKEDFLTKYTGIAQQIAGVMFAILGHYEKALEPFVDKKISNRSSPGQILRAAEIDFARPPIARAIEAEADTLQFAHLLIGLLKYKTGDDKNGNEGEKGIADTLALIGKKPELPQIQNALQAGLIVCSLAIAMGIPKDKQDELKTGLELQMLTQIGDTGALFALDSSKEILAMAKQAAPENPAIQRTLDAIAPHVASGRADVLAAERKNQGKSQPDLPG